MYKAVCIVGSLTSAIKHMLKELSEDVGRHEKALEQLAQIFDTTTEKLETQHESRTQTLSRGHCVLF